MKSLTLSALVIFVTCTCLAHGQEANQTAYDKELDLTLQYIANAEGVQGLWRDTRKLVEQAEASASQQDYETAITLLQTAQFQAETGYHQAVSQDTLDKLVPYYLK